MEHAPKAQIDRTKPPIEFAVQSPQLNTPEHVLLDNGVSVFVLNENSLEIVKIELVFAAGSKYQGQPLTAELTNLCVNKGTSNLTAEQIASNIDYYGAFLNTNADRDTASVTLYTMTQYLEKTLRILQELLSEPSFPTEELELSIVAERQQYLVQQDKVAVLARNKFMEAIYGPQHAYGRKVKLADFDGVKRNHLINFFKSNYGMENCTIFIAGGMDEHLLKQVNQTLGQIPQHSQAELQKPALLEEPALQKRHFLRKEDAMQNAIRMGRPLFNQKHKDYAELSVLCTVLGGYFGSRLMKNIREEKGYTYGIYASIYPFQASGYFFIASEVGVSVASDALSEIYSELKTLREQPIPDEELHTVKRYLSGSLLRKMDGPFAQLERFKELYINDLAPDFYSHFIQQIEGANAKRLQELAQTYFQPEDLYEVVAGEQATAF